MLLLAADALQTQGGGASYTSYALSVEWQGAAAGATVTVQKRFSEFDALRDALRDSTIGEALKMLDFPSKFDLFWSAESMAPDRQSKLSTWLASVFVAAARGVAYVTIVVCVATMFVTTVGAVGAGSGFE